MNYQLVGIRDRVNLNHPKSGTPKSNGFLIIYIHITFPSEMYFWGIYPISSQPRMNPAMFLFEGTHGDSGGGTIIEELWDMQEPPPS